MCREMGNDQSAVRSWPIVVWIRSVIAPELFNINVPFDNTTPMYLINLLSILGLGLGLDLGFTIFAFFRGK